jgi:hypothetical protein
MIKNNLFVLFVEGGFGITQEKKMTETVSYTMGIDTVSCHFFQVVLHQ